jgi:hypothetical protein
MFPKRSIFSNHLVYTSTSQLRLMYASKSEYAWDVPVLPDSAGMRRLKTVLTAQHIENQSFQSGYNRHEIRHIRSSK